MSLLLTLMCVSCQDDMFSDFENTVVSKPGQYDLTLEMMFAPEEEVELGSRSAGDRISDISNLFIALFDDKGEGVENWYFAPENGNWNQVSISKNMSGSQLGNDNLDDDVICKASTRISIPYNGSPMYLLAVANMGNVIEEYGYSTLEEFRAMKFYWDTKWDENSNSNRQMSGYFTVTEEASPLSTENLMQNGIPKLTLNGSETTLHAWLRRAASKVTVDFDASGLRENIWIFIKDVRIRDIPASCTAFNLNKPTKDEHILWNAEDGETLDYTGGKTDWRQWPSLSKTRSNLEKDFPNAHGTQSQSLFFFENMQGTGKDKAQIVDGNGSTPTYPEGSTPGKPGYKDEKKFGTYVEVNAYYYSTADNNVNSGPIVYRFMLGKDIKNDYNVERNHHYKLTLVFNGNANDADWHIDYKFAEDRYIPETYYISYLYGQRMHLPITIGNLEQIMPSYKNDGSVRISAEIIQSNWYPDAPAKKGSTSGVTEVEDYYDETLVHEDHQGPQTGFLSLHSNEYSRLNKANFIGRGKRDDKQYLLKYWKGNQENNNVPQGTRTFTVKYETKTHIGKDEGDLYQVTIDERKRNMVFYLPLYTRALFLVKEWSYTGNNPFEEFTRSAKVGITIEVLNSANKVIRTTTDTVNIVQVPRIFNPKGVYRKNGNNKPFQVKLMQAVPGTNGTQYETFLSKGPWSAQIEIASSNSNITIDGQKAVFGSTDSPINFNINFSSTEGATENQYAIILVRYHNYTCNHRIIVRQGYEPDIVSKSSKTKWHCFNLRHGARETTSPIESGGLFKYGNLGVAITEANITPAYFNIPAGSRPLEVMNNISAISTTTWDQIYPAEFSYNESNYFPGTDKGKITLNNAPTARMANGADFEALRDNEDTEYGYGICYADSALTTANVGVAGGSYYWKDESTHHLGTLGCFVYSKANSHNVFFPAGRTGFGDMAFDGSVRYGGTSASLANAYYRPLLWRLFKNYGVNYWLGDQKKTKDPWGTDTKYFASAWDINISSFDFNSYFTNAHKLPDGYSKYPSLPDVSKAFPIRLVD